jgi:hypothetical protein
LPHNVNEQPGRFGIFRVKEFVEKLREALSELLLVFVPSS